MVNARRKSIAGTGTPLADVGLEATTNRRVSLGLTSGRSPLREVADDRRHTIAEMTKNNVPNLGISENNALLMNSLEKIRGSARKSMDSNRKSVDFNGRSSISSSYAPYGAEREQDVSLMSLDDNDENFQAPGNRFSLMMQLDPYPEEDSAEDESVATAGAGGASSVLRADERAPGGLISHFVASHNLPVNDSGTFSVHSHVDEILNSFKRRSSLRRSSFGSRHSDSFGINIEEDENEPQNRLSVDEVLRSFRADPIATENAIAMVSATGKLLPSDFRKFVKAFKSPKRAASKKEPEQEEGEPQGVALRSWQVGVEESAVDDFAVDTTKASRNSLPDTSSILPCGAISDTVKPWTQLELNRASDVLRRASISFDGLSVEASILRDSSYDAEEEDPELSPLEMLRAEVEELKSQVATRNEEYNSSLRAKEKKAKSLNIRLASIRDSQDDDLPTYAETGKRSFANAVKELRSLEESRMIYELGSIRRGINRLTSLKIDLAERRKARKQRMQQMEEMGYEITEHAYRAASPGYGLYPSQRRDQYGPSGRWESSRSNTSRHSKSTNNQYLANNDFDDGDHGDYGGDDTQYEDQSVQRKLTKAAKKRTYKPRPIFKASPNTRYGTSDNLDFMALDEGNDLPDGLHSGEEVPSGHGPVDYEDLARLDEEYRKEKRLAAALRREEAHRRAHGPSDSEEDDEIAPPVKKRGPGRPRGTTKVVKSTRGPGRPKGSKNKKPRLQLANAVHAVVPKRPVGRPRKESTAAKKATEAAVNAAVRKIAKTQKQLDALHNGDVILSAKDVRKLEKRMEKFKAEAEAAAKGVSRPKRALTSYAVFCKQNRAEVLEENPDKKKPQEILCILAAKWKECTAEEKQMWQRQADEDNARTAKERGVVDEISSASEDDSEDEIEEGEKEMWERRAEEQGFQELELMVKTPKKKRGRPPFPKPDVDKDAEPVPKRPRGRPKKIKTPEELELEAMKAAEKAAEKAANKRPRGRPRKVREVEIDTVRGEAAEVHGEEIDAIIPVPAPLPVPTSVPAPESATEGAIELAEEHPGSTIHTYESLEGGKENVKENVTSASTGEQLFKPQLPNAVASKSRLSIVGRTSGVGIIGPVGQPIDGNTHIHFTSADNSLASIDTAQL